ncbi:MAG: T9SS type A sorting domain-containing protein, partial [Chitinophagales bacterium]
QAFPNPFDQKLTIQYKLESNGSLSNNIPIKIDAYHITGKTNFTIFEGDMNVGEQGEYILEASYLPIGMYIFRLETPDKVKIIKAIKH